MLAFALRRVISSIPTLFIVYSLIFLAMRIVPGDPAIAALGPFASEASLQSFREIMGLNMPLGKQYVTFLGDLLRGDLGRSVVNRQPVAQTLAHALPYTLELTVAGMVIGIVLALPLGVWAALRRNSWVDYFSRTVSLLGLSVPAFYLGILLIILFSIKMGWFPVAGRGEAVNVWDRLHRLFLPAVNIGLIMTAYNARMIRAAVLDVLGEDYVRTARAKGLAERVVIYRHVLSNALIPVVTIIGLNTSMLIGSSIMTEIVFNRPGLGSFIVAAMNNRDYTTIQSLVVVYATFVVLINLLTDIAYGWVDPRVRYS